MSPPRPSPSSGVASRLVALDALARIDQGAYANLVLPGLLERSGLTEQDRRLVTELVYGTTRMRRACDYLVDRFIRSEVEGAVRRILRLGAYQLHYMGVAAHAAVSSSVEASPHRAKGLVNAVLRRLATADPPDWPDAAVELSYPDWMVELLSADLGSPDALAMLAWMDRPGAVTERPDGYVQDTASQWVAEYVAAGPGTGVVDLCAGPGGKATALAGRADVVVAVDLHPARAGLVGDNARRLGLGNVAVVAADGRRPPLRPGSFERVLVDAPCSGLGVLRRRPDARWRLGPEAPDRLAGLQRELLRAAADLVAPGGRLIYSVCTVSSAETVGIDRWAARALPELAPLPGPGAPWREHGRGWLLLPQDADTDGMYVLGLGRAGRPGC